MKISFIEPAILLYAFAMTLTIPLTAQCVYRRIWEETGSSEKGVSLQPAGGNKWVNSWSGVYLHAFIE